MIEYALILGLIVIGLFVVFSETGSAIVGVWERLLSDSAKAQSGG